MKNITLEGLLPFDRLFYNTVLFCPSLRLGASKMSIMEVIVAVSKVSNLSYSGIN